MLKDKKKGIIGLMLLVALVAVFGYLGYSSMHQIKKGLDLQGGVSITYQAVDPNVTAEQMNDTKFKLQQRVQNYSTEAEVYTEGNDRINIDIPGASDANAILTELGQPGSLQFVDPDGTVILTGDQVSSAKAAQRSNGSTTEYVVALEFNDEGTKAFAEATERLVGQQIYIVYDNQIASAPTVQEAITGGECTIDGMSDYQEAETLASTIRIGSLSVELQEMRSNVVGAKLGSEAIATSKLAAYIGLAIIIIFMLIAFRVPGFAASLALVMFCGLEVLLIVAFDVTLTLAGIAGIVLSIGMAVDANCIIFTRIKEEIGLGKTVESAVKAGFNKALSAIIDGNITTLIAAGVLMIIGTGTVKGFGITLGLGVIVSMFTALAIVRLLLMAFVAVGLDKPYMYGSKKEGKIYDFVGKKKIFFGISIAAIVIGLAFIGVNEAKLGEPVNYSIDFAGGTMTTVTFNEDVPFDTLSTEVVPEVASVIGSNDIQIQKVTGSNEVIFKTPTLSVEQREALTSMLGEKYSVAENNITAESISGAISSEMRRSAFIAVVVSLILMFIYICIRFKDMKFAASAIACLAHDVLVLFGCYVIFRWSVGSTFIACMLTLVGYSINDTIVVFDRIRENKLTMSKSDRALLVNTSVSETMSRSIYTSLTTFVMVACLYVVGVTNVKEFALPLMIGTVVGTYSSVAVAAPLWHVLTTISEKKKASQGTVKSSKKSK